MCFLESAVQQDISLRYEIAPQKIEATAPDGEKEVKTMTMCHFDDTSLNRGTPTQTAKCKRA